MGFDAFRFLGVFRLFRLGTTPGRVRALSALVLLALAALCLATGLGMADARAALRAVGQGHGPMVVATGNVYLALSDMDAQVTNVLLTGEEDGWLCDPDRDEGQCERGQPRFYYEIRRDDAQRAMLQAARLAEDDPVQMRTVQDVLRGLALYDQRVQAAMEHGRESDHAHGALPADALAEYRAATALMTDELLPKAGNLTLDGAAVVDATYDNRRDAVLWARTRVIVLGSATVLALLTLQIYLGMRFRRAVNPALAVATVLAIGLTVGGASLMGTEAARLRTAKERGFDQLLTVSRAQALGKSLDVDRTRFLLDPGTADRHDQTYLERSQAIFYIDRVSNLEAYYTKLDERLARYRESSGRVPFGGLYGALARAAETPEQRRDLDRLLASYQEYQHGDRRVRGLADGGKRAEAARAHLDGLVPHLPHPAFRVHDQWLDAAQSRHQYVMNRSVRSGQDALALWGWGLPAWALSVAVLVVAGVWPRLREYLGTPPTPDAAPLVTVAASADEREGG